MTFLTFNYRWDILKQCLEQGMDAHWHAFRDRVLQPTLDDVQPPSLTKICARYGIADESKASNMIITVKRRFQAALQRNLRTTVASEDGMEGELQEILGFLPRSAQDSEGASDSIADEGPAIS